MNCENNNAVTNRGNGFIIIVVLYVLLAIILSGSNSYNSF